MVPRKTLDHTYHKTIYESDPSYGLEIMRCSNKVPKSITLDITRGRMDSSYSSILIYIYIAIWAILW